MWQNCTVKTLLFLKIWKYNKKNNEQKIKSVLFYKIVFVI